MTAYLYGDITVTDPAVYEQYRAGVPAIVAAHGGSYLVRGGPADLLEGDDAPMRQVLLAFPDMASLLAFYDSPEYVALRAIRRRSSTGRLVAIEGI